MTFKIGISQLYDQSEPKNWKWNKTRHFSKGNIQIWHHFLSKHIKVFQWVLKLTFLNFMTKVNPKNGNEIKSDIFPWDIFKSGIIFIDRKILKYFNNFYNWRFSISLQSLDRDQRSIQFLGYHKNCVNCLIIKTFKNIWFALSIKIMLFIKSSVLKNKSVRKKFFY